MFITEQSGIDNLKNEGTADEKVHLVGNVMIDTLLANKQKAEQSNILQDMALTAKQYAVITLHRPSNVDDLAGLEKIIAAFEVIQKDLKLVFPIHPRTRNNIAGTKLQARIEAMENLILMDPVGDLAFLKLMANAALVMTDSGGIQEETTILGVPCMTLRPNTERPVTITEGTNQLVKLTTEDILDVYEELKEKNFNIPGKIPNLWDGKAAERIAQTILNS